MADRKRAEADDNLAKLAEQAVRKAIKSAYFAGWRACEDQLAQLPDNEHGMGVRTLAEAKLAHIRYVLARVGGNRKRAAKLLSIGQRTLYRRLKDIQGQQKRQAADGHKDRLLRRGPSPPRRVQTRVL